MRINARRPSRISAGLAVVFTLGVALVFPSGVMTQDAPSDASGLVERVLAFVRSHPRMRGSFEHTYLDRSRAVVLHHRGTFAFEAPRIRVTLEGEEPREIAVDAATARVLIPGAPAPLVLSFAIGTTPLPLWFAALEGSAPLSDLFALRTIVAEGAPVVELRPREPTSSIDRVWLELGPDGAPRRWLLVDAVGGTHRLVLDAVRYPASIPASVFALDPPLDAVVVEP